jgi:hypothetical protein
MAEGIIEPSKCYSIVEDETLEQGDILPRCPVFRPSPDLLFPFDTNIELPFEYSLQSVIVMSQSCDIKPGQKDVVHALLCSVTEFSTTQKNWGQLEKNRILHLHLLNATCPCDPWKDQYLVVSFKDIWNLPVSFLMKFAASLGPRLRLKNPYRENLSHFFGNYFSRVALPD